MLLPSFAANVAAQEPAENPKPAIERGAPFVDNAILQHQMPVPVWGWNRPGTVLSRPSLPGIASEWKGPSRMYNMKIAPLIPYAIRGAIWCQGTHNAGDGRIYAAKMEALVDGWRKNWGRPDLPFYFTQMQCYGEPDPNNVGFADIREAQTMLLKTPDKVTMHVNHRGLLVQTSTV